MSMSRAETTPVENRTAPIETDFRKRTLVLLLPAITAMYGVYQGIQQVLLPAQVEAIDPASKVTNLAALAVVSSIAGTVALPLGGAISDRTRSRLGRRTPWLIGMSIISVGLATVMGMVSTFLSLAIVYGLLWFAMNWYQGVVYAIIPDRIPERLRGTASSVVGLALPLGVLIFVNVVSRTTQQLGYVIVGLGLLATTLLLVTIDREGPTAGPLEESTASDGSGPRSRRSFWSFFSSFRSLDFSLVFISRILFFFGYFAVASYVFYILTDSIGMENVPAASAQVAVSTLATITTVCQIAAVAIFGWVADHFNIRKLVVGFSAFGMAVAFAIPLVFPTWAGMLLYAGLMGASMGVYFAVDVAVMSLVLPSPGDEGRDLGLLAIATSVPSALAPAVAALLINGTGSYNSLFVFGIAAAVLGGTAVMFVRSVR